MPERRPPLLEVLGERVVARRPLDIETVLRLLPHRYPMLLVDRIDHVEPGRCAEGVKCVTTNEPFLVGHFPGYPIMPGVLIVDALAQVAGIMLRAPAEGDVPAPEAGARPEGNPLGVLAAIQKMRFVRQVRPGDRLCLRVRLLKTFGSTHLVVAEAFVDNALVAAGELVLAS
jgi:beta-hydroxyacyl-ACP dehydratase FabZ